jgi:AraC-like DNA-binding protein
MTDNALFLLPALRRARDLIDREYAEPLDLDAMASEAGYSRFHFARAFAAAYGETPRAYLTRRRIERAKTLLRTANLSVTEICFLVGFSSLGSFSTRFRALVGASPSEYRDDVVARGRERRAAIGIRRDRDGGDAEPPRRPRDPRHDLAAIGAQDRREASQGAVHLSDARAACACAWR